MGVGLAADSDPAVRHAEGLTTVPLTPPLPYEKVLTWRRSAVPSPALQALLQTLSLGTR